jgi:hypothetical protein
VPSFDNRSSKLDGREAEFLRGVLGPGKPQKTSLRVAVAGYRSRQRRAMFRRGLVVLLLLGGVCGSALILGGSRTPVAPDSMGGSAADDPLTTGSTGWSPKRAARSASCVPSSGSIGRACAIGSSGDLPAAGAVAQMPPASEDGGR